MTRHWLVVDDEGEASIEHEGCASYVMIYDVGEPCWGHVAERYGPMREVGEDEELLGPVTSSHYDGCEVAELVYEMGLDVALDMSMREVDTGRYEIKSWVHEYPGGPWGGPEWDAGLEFVEPSDLRIRSELWPDPEEELDERRPMVDVAIDDAQRWRL